MYKKKKKIILITGCAGFIGSKVANYLINKKHLVYGIDDLSQGSKTNIPKKLIFTKGDCSKKNILKKFKNLKIDYILHFAGQSSGEKSFYDPEKDLKKNILTTFNLLKFAEIIHCKHFIFSSSMSVYGNNVKKIAKESDTCNPISFYGASKLASENYIKLFSNKKINFTILRLFSVYGIGQKLNKLDQGLIRIFLTQIKKGQNLFVKGKLTRSRDFIYIDDVVKNIVKIMGKKKYFNNTFNLGTGREITIKKLLENFKKIINKKIKIKLCKPTPLDQNKIFACTKKMKKFNLKTNVKLEKGLKMYINSLGLIK